MTAPTAEDVAREWLKRFDLHRDGYLCEQLTILLTTYAASVRPPGTVAICENHVYTQCAEHTGAFTFEACPVKPCPQNYSGAIARKAMEEK